MKTFDLQNLDVSTLFVQMFVNEAGFINALFVAFMSQ